MKEYYYYHRDEANVPLITVCLLKDSDVVAKGTSICSPLDSPCKKEGRRIARNKALKALGTKKNGDETIRGRAFDVMDDVGIFIPYKSVYRPRLSEFEERLLSYGQK